MKKQFTDTAEVGLTKKQKAILKSKAKQSKLTVSEYIRKRLLKSMLHSCFLIENGSIRVLYYSRPGYFLLFLFRWGGY